jgi:hypothetical protein
MELTGKCKDDFEKWYLKDQHNEEGYHDYLLRSFYSKGLAMQYGVYVDFFDSVKYEGKGLFTILFKKYYEQKTDDFSHMNIAVNAIQKGNEIYNN